MTELTEGELGGAKSKVVYSRWQGGEPAFIVVIVHGYGEHIGRYDHVARPLVDAGAVVYGPDLPGHGRSDGERALVGSGQDLLDVVALMVKTAGAEHPELPLGLIGHSMGGIVATRYAQESPTELDALVLSGPAIGGNPMFTELLESDPIPEVPIDPAMLSRDPKVGEAYANDELVYHGPFKRQTLVTLLDEIGAVAGGPSLASIPMLWLHGENDPLAPLDLTGDAIALIGGEQVDKQVYEGAMHEVFNETNRGEVINDVVQFLDRSLSAAIGASNAPSPQERLVDTNTEAPQDRLAT